MEIIVAGRGACFGIVFALINPSFDNFIDDGKVDGVQRITFGFFWWESWKQEFLR